MYLREMGGVELLSREGEIAIAKRIEAGKDVDKCFDTKSNSWKENFRVEGTNRKSTAFSKRYNRY